MRHVLFSIFFSFLSCTAFSATASVQEYQLANGLKLIVKTDHRAPVVLNSVWYKVGGSNEPNGITGISHALEHMMFRGTTKYPPGEFDKIINNNGGQQNAETAADYTVYFQYIGANKLALCLALEADRMENLLFSPTLYAKEIQVVMEERRMRVEDNPESLAWEQFMAAAHVNNPYHHLSIGWMTDLENMTLQDVQNWYQQWYVPNNAVIVIVGDVEPNKVYDLVKHYFGKIPAKTLPPIKPRTEVPALGEKWVNINVSAKLPVLMMGYQTPSLTDPKSAQDAYALKVLAFILGGSNSSRFQQQLVRDKQLAANAYASYDPFTRYADLLTLIGIPAPNSSIKILKAAFFAEVKQLQQNLVNDAELKQVKAQVLASNIYKKDSPIQEAMSLGKVTAINLPWQIEEEYTKNISAVTPEQIQAVAKKYLVPDHLTITVLHPTVTQNGK